jgi:hypothetical protein
LGPATELTDRGSPSSSWLPTAGLLPGQTADPVRLL